MIFHLVETATQLAHYYIRHMSNLRRSAVTGFRCPMDEKGLLQLLFDYPIRYARLYLEAAVGFCREMIRSYSVQASVDVPIPNYRGFHVRPSTMIAKIVAHYGSRVTMTLDGQEYDASSALDLFRANEQINAAKRRHIASLLGDQRELAKPVPSDPYDQLREFQLLLVDLVNEDRIVVYDSRIDPESIGEAAEPTMAGFAARVIKYLVSVAKVDIRSDISVQFTGDSRALADLETLAKNGYGEDDMGNNIVLPEELAYLRR
jgi:hypothetical protein